MFSVRVISIPDGELDATKWFIKLNNMARKGKLGKLKDFCNFCEDTDGALYLLDSEGQAIFCPFFYENENYTGGTLYTIYILEVDVMKKCNEGFHICPINDQERPEIKWELNLTHLDGNFTYSSQTLGDVMFTMQCMVGSEGY